MTDIDQIARRLSDLETIVKEQGYRIKALEKAGEPQVKGMYAVLSPEQQKQVKNYRGPENIGFADVAQFCDCGKDRLLCRAPECPSHKTDPMGR